MAHDWYQNGRCICEHFKLPLRKASEEKLLERLAHTDQLSHSATICLQYVLINRKKLCVHFECASTDTGLWYRDGQTTMSGTMTASKRQFNTATLVHVCAKWLASNMGGTFSLVATFHQNVNHLSYKHIQTSHKTVSMQVSVGS